MVSWSIPQTNVKYVLHFDSCHLTCICKMLFVHLELLVKDKTFRRALFMSICTISANMSWKTPRLTGKVLSDMELIMDLDFVNF